VGGRGQAVVTAPARPGPALARAGLGRLLDPKALPVASLNASPSREVQVTRCAPLAAGTVPVESLASKFKNLL
jgi:hypothetical protein